MVLSLLADFRPDFPIRLVRISVCLLFCDAKRLLCSLLLMSDVFVLYFAAGPPRVWCGCMAGCTVEKH